MNENDLQVPVEPLGRKDQIGIVVGMLLLLLLGFWRSWHCIFWGDEIFGLVILKAPSSAQMWNMWNHGLDGSGLFFYLLGRPWIHIFGSSELSLRMFSAAGVAGAFAFVWLAARRIYSTPIVAAAAFYVFVSNDTLLWQLSNGRSYGIFILAVAIEVYVLGWAADQRGTSPALALSMFLASFLLSGAQFFGLAYSICLVAALIALDLLTRRFRPVLYLSAMAGWGALAFTWRNLVTSAAVGKDGFWTVRPTFRDLMLGDTAFGLHVSIVIFGLVALVGLASIRLRRHRMFSYVIIAFLLLSDVAFFAKSRFGISAYASRYLLPLATASILLICELLTQFRESSLLSSRARERAPIVILALAGLVYAGSLVTRNFLPLPDFTAKLLASVPGNMPIVDCDGASFIDLEFYRHFQGTKFYFPVDWDLARNPANRMFDAAAGYHEFENWKKWGIYSSDIVTTPEIVEKLNDFVVIVQREQDVWFRNRVLADTRFTAVHIGSFEQTQFPLELWVVHRSLRLNSVQAHPTF